MSESYRLVFRGEVMEGQHPAVVRKRLAEAARFDNGQLDTLFSGKAVVVKRDADPATAARLQALFRDAGARLRVIPAGTGSDGGDPESATATTGPAAGGSAPAVPPWQILPPGSDLLRDDERERPEAVEVDVSGLSLAPVQFSVPGPVRTISAPDVSHLTLAAPGALLGDADRPPPPPVPTPQFEVAAAGADLSPRRMPGPPPPDVSHLRLEDDV